jgi:hypothetical protein
MNNAKNITENWIKWVPAAGLANKYYISEVYRNIDAGFSVKLIESGNGKKGITLVFPESVWCYRSSGGGITPDNVFILNSPQPKDWPLFKIENSDYLKWIEEESEGLYEGWGLQHFCIITDDEIFDIISTYEPDIIKNEE